MKTKSALINSALLALSGSLVMAAPVGTAFTYQGQLTEGGRPANGRYDLKFTLYDEMTGGQAWFQTVTNAGVGVTNGLFTAMVDFGSRPFDNTARWLEIAVATNGSSGFVVLEPRQPVTASPQALFALKAESTRTAESAAFVTQNGVSTIALQDDAVIGAKIADGTIGEADFSAALATGTFWRLGGNAGTAPGAQFLGTIDNQPIELKVAGQRALRIEPTTNSPNVLAGWNGNTISSGVVGATVSGGGEGNGWHHRADADFVTVGGGRRNQVDAGATAATVAGGEQNLIQNNSVTATIGGGANNLIRGQVNSAVIAGGSENEIESRADGAAIGGGFFNLIAPDAGAATIPGGLLNRAAGVASFAAGQRAQANHAGTFVWADLSDADFTSSASNQFLIRASGGVGIGTGAPQQALHVVGDAKVQGTNFTATGHTARLILGDENHILRSIYGHGVRLGVWPDPNAFAIQDVTANVGIGTTNPATRLEVQGGPIKATGGLIIETRTSDPANPAPGQIWLRTDL